MKALPSYARGSELCTSGVNTLEGAGHFQFFASSVLPSSVVTIHVSGKARLARGALAVSFTDRDGKAHRVPLELGEPGSLEANVRAARIKGNPGFFLSYSPANAQSRSADGLVLR